MTAFLAAYGVRQAPWISNGASSAKRRFDAYGTLSALITEVVLTPAEQRARATGAVLSAFADLDRMVIEDLAAQGDADLGLAARSRTIARMRAAFMRLAQDLDDSGGGTRCAGCRAEQLCAGVFTLDA